jgi:hypothetical protein
MANKKPHLEFSPVDMEQGWQTPPGYKEGFEQKILVSDLDEVNKRGSRSRLLRIRPGVFSEVPFVHDHWEEVFLFQGDLIVAGEQFFAPTYAIRPPGVYHGPFKSEKGCVLFELHYYES